MKKILVIEDDEFLGNGILERLQKEGYIVEIETDGQIGLNKISEFLPDLVLMDMMLPSLNGYEILEAKNANSTIKDIPVIVISNSGQEVEINKIKSLGVKDYIVKVQFSPKEVVDKVDTFLRPIDFTKHVAVEKTDNETTQSSIRGKRFEGLKILVVEDDAFLGDLLTRKIMKEGAEIHHSLSGEDALSTLKTFKPDLITLDIVLPGMSGLEALKEIKNNQELKNIPVVILSNLSQKEDATKAMNFGAKDFLVKSLYTLEEIVEKLRAILHP